MQSSAQQLSAQRRELHDAYNDFHGPCYPADDW